MRSIRLLSSLVALAAAAPAPAPQDIEFDLVAALPNPTYTTASDVTAQTVTYTPNAIYSDALPQITATDDASPTFTGVPVKRAAACAALPTGAGPIANPDTAANFLAIPELASTALAASTPAGYTQVFSNLNASNNAYGYLGYTTFKTYDVAGCAAKCNSINGCVSFNIYFERGPSVDPGTGASGCANPPSTTLIKCAFWGGPITVANANNPGQFRNQFQVVIAGSNGYVSNSIASVPGYGPAIPLGNAAINAPYDALGFSSYMGVAMFTDGPFNASLCARACSEKSAYAIAHPPTDGTPVQTCQFFNTYILYINSTSNPNNIQGQYCAMYSESWSSKYATNVGQYRGNDHYLIQYSFAYSNATNPGSPNADAAVHQASRDISYSTLQPFCSSYIGATVASTTVTATATSAPLTTQTITSTTTVSSTSSTTTTTVSDTSSPTGTTITVTVTPITITPSVVVPRDVAEPTFPAWLLPYVKEVNTTSNAKRALSTPSVLTKYPASILSSACSLQVTPGPSSVVTITVSATTTLATSTQTVTVTATATVKPNTCGTDGPQFRLKVSAPGSEYDGTYAQSSDGPGYYIGDSASPYYNTALYFSLNPSTGLLTTPRGNYFGRTNIGDFVAPAALGNDAGSAATCAVDPSTHELTCSITQTNGALDPPTSTYSYFYIIRNLYVPLLALGRDGDAGYSTYGYGGAVPAKVYASCD